MRDLWTAPAPYPGWPGADRDQSQIVRGRPGSSSGDNGWRCRYTSMSRLSGRVVMQRPAKPCTSVRFRAQPPNPPDFSWSALGSAFIACLSVAPSRTKVRPARVAKSVDARDLKSLDPRSCGFESRPGHHSRLPLNPRPLCGCGPGLAGRSKLLRAACIGCAIRQALSLPACSFTLRAGGSIAPATQFTGFACLLATP